MARAQLALLLGLALAAVPTPATEPRRAGPRDVCPVCGMVVALHGDWIAQVVLEDGSALFFDGSKDMFRYLLARERYDPQRADRPVAGVFVTTYYELEVIPAKSACFVVGSDVLGPMGAELVPHASRAEAEEFRRDHGGRSIVVFQEVTPELLAGLR